MENAAGEGVAVDILIGIIIAYIVMHTYTYATLI